MNDTRDTWTPERIKIGDGFTYADRYSGTASGTPAPAMKPPAPDIRPGQVPFCRWRVVEADGTCVSLLDMRQAYDSAEDGATIWAWEDGDWVQYGRDLRPLATAPSGTEGEGR